MHRQNVGKLTLIGHDEFHLEVEDRLSMFSAQCTDIPPGGQCTSTWRWTFRKAR
jgi:hypothetical protein